jgi:hypothetical protein
MSDTMPSLIHRLNNTPLRELLRGRVTNRLDLAARLAASGLPKPTRELIARVVRRTALWRMEKLAVAEELIAHFLDGQAAGESIEDLVARFGDERIAAKLIRRAKVRNRPLVYHVFRRVCQLINALVVFYALATGWFWIGKPSPSIDYVAELNKPVLAVPVEQRAWPAYSEVLQRIKPSPDASVSEKDVWQDILDARPGSEMWSVAKAWLTGRQADLEDLRQATERPRLGFVLTGSRSSELDAPTTIVSLVAAQQEEHLDDMRLLGLVLAADAALARELGDAARLRRDIEALLRISHHLHAGGDQFLIGELTAISIRELALEALQETLVTAPSLLGDGDLVALAHEIATVSRAGDLLSYRGERLLFYDLLQRIYTNDGHGDGRITPEGLRFVANLGTLMNSKSANGIEAEPVDPGMVFMGTAVMLASASREDMCAEYNAMLDQAETQLARPLCETDWSRNDSRIAAIRASMVDFARYWPIALFAPALERSQWTAERMLGYQDGILVGIALELYRRRHGQYPVTLVELVPQLLPVVPADRITGDPVKYRLVDGNPLVYSVGADRTDNGGEIYRMPGGRAAPHHPAQWGKNIDDSAKRADWVLYPQSQE